MEADVATLGQLGFASGDALGRYEVDGVLGIGGMSAVLAARDVALGREVAIKVLLPAHRHDAQLSQRFQREARALAAVEHPNVMRVLDVGMANQVAFIVLERIRGASLQELLTTRGQMPIAVCCAIAEQLASALAAVHAAGVVHRDVKPGNILLTQEGRLVLADFGVARWLDADDLHTRAGAVLGTPAFMAPEQALAASSEVGPAADVYGFGATLYALASGHPPPRLTSPASSPNLRKAAPHVWPEFAGVVQRMMAWDANARPSLKMVAQTCKQELARWTTKPEMSRLADYARGARCSDDVARAQEVALTTARELKRRGQVALALSYCDFALAHAADNADVLALVASMSERRTWPRWLVLLGVVAVCTGILVVVTRSVRVELGSATAIANDAGADAAHDVVDATASDAQLDAQGLDAPRMPTIVRRSADARVAVPAPALAVDAGATDSPPARVGVYFASDVACELAIDGVLYGTLDKHRAYDLAAGPHAVTCVKSQPLGGMLEWKRTIQVPAQPEYRVVMTLLPVIRVTLGVAGARATINGQSITASGLRVTPARVRIEFAIGADKQLGWVSLPTRDCTLQWKPLRCE